MNYVFRLGALPKTSPCKYSEIQKLKIQSHFLSQAFGEYSTRISVYLSVGCTDSLWLLSSSNSNKFKVLSQGPLAVTKVVTQGLHHFEPTQDASNGRLSSGKPHGSEETLSELCHVLIHPYLPSLACVHGDSKTTDLIVISHHPRYGAVVSRL
jgi:hypothetical protein